MANRFGRAGGNWSAAGTWSATSGGASDGAGINAGDDVILDANSSGTFTIDTAISIVSIVCTGFTGTLTHNAVTLTISGNTFTLVAGMTYTPSANTRIVSFGSTSGTTAITTAGKTLGAVILSGVGGTFQLQDGLTVRSDGTITLTNGTFNANNFNVTTGGFTSSNSNTRVITMGSGTWHMTNPNGAVFDLTTGTNLTLNANTSTLLVSSAIVTSSPLRSIHLGNKSFNIVTIANTGSSGVYTDVGGAGPTIATLNLTAPVAIRFSSTTTYTITNAFTWAGTAFNNAISLIAAAASTVTIAAASGSTIEWAALAGINFSGTAVNATNSFDLKGNNMNGGSITGPSGGGSAVVGVIGS